MISEKRATANGSAPLFSIALRTLHALSGNPVREPPARPCEMALTNTTRYYVSFGGSRAIGFSKDYLSDPQGLFYHDGYTTDDVAAFPYDCAMSGELTYNG